ncbi:hypothetical protein JXA88_17170 [Candidatus Fermentibacteria bacterium]|nr:hypothetical protein [Candidatus Fermentibacteria bacterium]
MTTICLFEDQEWRGLLPLTWLHPCWDLATGAHTVLARVRATFPGAEIRALCRPWLAQVVAERSGLEAPKGQGETLWISGRTVDVSSVAQVAVDTPGPFALWNSETLVAFRIEDARHVPAPEHLVEWVRSLGLPRLSCQARVFRRWWDLISLNSEMLAQDLGRFPLGVQEGTVMPGAHLLDPATVYLGHGAEIEPSAVIDSRPGPVVLDHHAHVGAGSLVVGPAYLGRETLVKPLSHLGPEISAGPWCRLGGEIARSIFLGYGNKQHHGFLGHAYVGNWVNLGAGTTNSNLKNTYGPVKVWVDGRLENSGLTFLGCALGDHAKTAINTVFNTGTVVGVCANVFLHGFPDKCVPSFSWGPHKGAFQLDSALAIASRVMARRGVKLTAAEASLLTEVWGLTSPERAPAKTGLCD